LCCCEFQPVRPMFSLVFCSVRTAVESLKQPT
jgi:hypothetical protein